ncbi:MAG: type 4a pilus biogenesis protein PilO [Planctomycetales bacterium]|nr:type 4a pilus biogenesis protein PilO [Planctomycetales bacterium]
MKLSAEKRKTIIALLLGGGAIAYMAGVYWPRHKANIALREEIQTQQDYIRQCAPNQQALAALQQDLNEAASFSDAWRHKAPPAKHPAPAISALTRCAGDAGVRTLQFTPRTAEPMAVVAKVPVSLVCAGTLPQVVDLLARIEDLAQTVWVDHLHVTAPEQGEEQIQCELELVVFADNQSNSD